MHARARTPARVRLRARGKPGASDVVRWGALPKRLEDLLQEAALLVRLHAQDVRDRSVLAVVESVGESSARGERATLSI